MADEQRVPASADENADRVQDRPYESDFSRLPASETHERTGPGGGPHGTVDSGGTNLPLVVMAIGALVTFAVFLLASPWVLGIGLALIVAGAIWAGVRVTYPGSRQGSGSTTVESSGFTPREGSAPGGAGHGAAAHGVGGAGDGDAHGGAGH